MSLGTPYYMSPEQASADRDPDARSDVYSLASVLFEMLTGEPPFSGATAQAVLSKILTADPTRPTELRRSIPPHVEAALLKGLERLPADRFASAAEFGAAVGNPDFRQVTGAYGEVGTRAAGVRGADRRVRVLSALAVVFAMAFVAASVWALSLRQGSGPVAAGAAVEFVVQPDSTHQIVSGVPASVALNREGTAVAYVGRRTDGSQQVYIRRFEQRSSIPVPASEGAASVVFSPDGEWVAFSTVDDGELRKVRTDGSALTTVAPLSGVSLGAAWGEDDHIVYGVAGPPGLMRVSAAGGDAEEILAQEGPVTGAADPVHLPGSNDILFTVIGTGPEIAILDSQTRGLTRLKRGMSPRYVESAAVMLYAEPGATDQNEGVNAEGFDLATASFTGEPRRIIGAIDGWLTLAALFSTSDAGAIAYLSGSRGEGELLLLARDLRQTSFEETTGASTPRVAPDGDRVVYATHRGGQSALHVFSVSERTTRSIVAGASFAKDRIEAPSWSPSGDSVVFEARDEGDGSELFIVSVRGGAVRRLDAEGPNLQRPAYTWDGEHVVFTVTAGVFDVLAVPVVGGEAIPVATAEAWESQPAPSPVGPWIAYTSDATGRSEVYLTRFPPDGRTVSVSNEGGLSAAWSATGDTIFYSNGLELIAAALDLGDEPRVLSRSTLMPWAFAEDRIAGRSYDVHANGFVAVGTRAVGAELIVRTRLPLER